MCVFVSLLPFFFFFKGQHLKDYICMQELRVEDQFIALPVKISRRGKKQARSVHSSLWHLAPSRSRGVLWAGRRKHVRCQGCTGKVSAGSGATSASGQRGTAWPAPCPLLLPSPHPSLAVSSQGRATSCHFPSMLSCVARFPHLAWAVQPALPSVLAKGERWREAAELSLAINLITG